MGARFLNEQNLPKEGGDRHFLHLSRGQSSYLKINNLFLTRKSKSYNKTLNESSLKNMFSCKVRNIPQKSMVQKNNFSYKEKGKN